jgi:hypothetical protein
MLLPAQTRSRECAHRDEKPANSPTARRTAGLSYQGKDKKNSSKMNERRGNAYEKKGPLRKTGKRSGNVIENKDTYRFIPGMLLKVKEL